MSTKIRFKEPAFTIEEQLRLLKNRKLLIPDISEAKHYLSTIGYYRLKAYFKPFLISSENSENGFKPNIQFSDVLNLYIFDRELRLLVTDALERIEIALRATLSNAMSIKYGSHWYANRTLFISQSFHNNFLDEINENLKRTKEDFIQTYYDTYESPEHPPGWMVMECLSFGTVSKAYSNLKNRSDRKQISNTFGQYSEITKSWMKSLSYTRNLCAHHSRLWNRFFINKPKEVPPKLVTPVNDSPFSLQAYIIIQLLNKIAPHHHWKKRLLELLKENPSVPLEKMGFCREWQNDVILNS